MPRTAFVFLQISLVVQIWVTKTWATFWIRWEMVQNAYMHRGTNSLPNTAWIGQWWPCPIWCTRSCLHHSNFKTTLILIQVTTRLALKIVPTNWTPWMAIGTVSEFMLLPHLGLLAISMLAQLADRPEVRKRTRCMLLPPSLNVVSNIKVGSWQVWPLRETDSLVTQCEAWSSSMTTSFFDKKISLNNMKRGQRNKQDLSVTGWQDKRCSKRLLRKSLDDKLKHSRQDLLNDTKRWS